eukprot:5768168-Prymnesium_polylepis.1
MRLFLRHSIIHVIKADRNPEASPAMRLATSAAVRGRISGWVARRCERRPRGHRRSRRYAASTEI